MKKNVLTYILIFIVVVVWGVVFYRIFGPSDKNKTEQNFSSVPDVEDTSKRRKLLLNYRDPFKVENVKDDHDKHADIQTVEEAPAFIYKGLIKGTRRSVVIVENNGISEIVRLKDSLLGYKVIAASKDSIILRKSRTRYTLLKN